jgi:hypothetical protein
MQKEINRLYNNWIHLDKVASDIKADLGCVEPDSRAEADRALQEYEAALARLAWLKSLKLGDRVQSAIGHGGPSGRPVTLIGIKQSPCDWEVIVDGLGVLGKVTTGWISADWIWPCPGG